jgi:hypothetical protein
MKVINDAGMKENPIENMNEAITPFGLPSKSLIFFVNLKG